MGEPLEELEQELLNDAENLDGEAEELTAAEVLTELENAWLNEKFSPEILPHKNEYVECMLDQIMHMESNIGHLPKEDIKIDIHKLEIDRIRYIIASYLRCRLKKIEQYAFHILEQEQRRDADEKYLSEAETMFAHEFVMNTDLHLESVMKEMPINCKTLDPSHKRIKPDMDSYVFLRVVHPPQGEIILKDVFLNQEEVIDLNDLKSGSQHLLPYECVASNVRNGYFQLI